MQPEPPIDMYVEVAVSIAELADAVDIMMTLGDEVVEVAMSIVICIFKSEVLSGFCILALEAVKGSDFKIPKRLLTE